MRVRAFARDDLAVVEAIQHNSPATAQWHGGDYLRLADDPGGAILVAEVDRAEPPVVAGYAAFHRIGDEAELHNLAVDPAQRRRGLGRALLAAGVRTMRELGVRHLFLEVRATNLAAIELYRSLGFRLLYTRRNYYQNPEEDALVMGCDINPRPEVSRERDVW